MSPWVSGWADLSVLPTPLASVLARMCLDSQICFPMGGMWPSRLVMDVAVSYQPTRATESNARLCEWFRCCVQGVTDWSAPHAAQDLVDELLSAIRASFPGGAIHIEIELVRGWFDALHLWVTTPAQQLYLCLDWTVS